MISKGLLIRKMFTRTAYKCCCISWGTRTASLKKTLPKTCTFVVVDPHHALVVYGHSFCSGTFIGSKLVLTAASCFERDINYEIFVKYGCRNFLDEGYIIPVADRKEHEYFQYRSALDNDIALVVLKEHVKFDNTVRKILLVEPDIALPAGSMMTITGWGAKNWANSQDRHLMRARMILLEEEECSKAYDKLFTSSMFCAKYDPHRLNDNGGAAVYNGLVVGISSYGASGEHIQHVVLLTNVSYFYKWIKLNTERLMTIHCSGEED